MSSTLTAVTYSNTPTRQRIKTSHVPAQLTPTSNNYRSSSAHRHHPSSSSLHGDNNCKKNPGHSQFIPINSLKVTDLRDGFDDEIWVDLIKSKAPETVRMKMDYTCVSRPDDLGFREYKGTKRVRHGSGTAFMMNMDKTRPCPFVDCPIKDPHHVSGVFKVMTASHVVYNEEEALKTTVYFFHDDDHDLSNVVEARGLKVSSVDVNRNRSIVECVTHDLTLCEKLANFRKHRENLVNKLSSMRPVQKENAEKMVVMISHPHGLAKHVSVGMLRGLAKDEKPVQVQCFGGKSLVSCQLTYTTPTCPGSGGGSVNVFCAQDICIAFAPHCACGENSREGVSGLGWTLLQFGV